MSVLGLGVAELSDETGESGRRRRNPRLPSTASIRCPCLASASRNCRTSSWATGRTAGHHADQQAEHQGERGSPDGGRDRPRAAGPLAVPRVTTPTSRPSTRASEAAPMGDEIGPRPRGRAMRAERPAESRAISPAGDCLVVATAGRGAARAGERCGPNGPLRAAPSAPRATAWSSRPPDEAARRAGRDPARPSSSACQVCSGVFISPGKRVDKPAPVGQVVIPRGLPAAPARSARGCSSRPGSGWTSPGTSYSRKPGRISTPLPNETGPRRGSRRRQPATRLERATPGNPGASRHRCPMKPAHAAAVVGANPLRSSPVSLMKRGSLVQGFAQGRQLCSTSGSSGAISPAHR